jgi:hypothetical protein
MDAWNQIHLMRDLRLETSRLTKVPQDIDA